MEAIPLILKTAWHFANIEWNLGMGISFTYLQLFLFCLFIGKITKMTIGNVSFNENRMRGNPNPTPKGGKK